MKSLMITSLLVILMFSGCTSGISEYFTLGKQKTICEEEGCDYSDAGICGSPMDILLNKEQANKMSYTKIKCGKVN